MRQQPGMFPGRPPIRAVLAAFIVLATPLSLGLHRETAFFVLGAASCGLGLALTGRIVRPGFDARAMRLLESAAGELKNAVQTISGFAGTIAGWSAREGAEWRGSCDHLVEVTRQLAQFTAQLHDYARFERGALRLPEQQVDAAELVAAALATCEEKADRADVFIAADLSCSAELRCDSTRIRQIIASLIQWMVDVSPPDSVIDIRLMKGPAAALDVRISNPLAQVPAGTGPEMFEPQLPLKGLNSLALPIARRVALLHCGDVRVETSHGAGVSICLFLPAHRVDWPEMKKPMPTRAA